MRHRRELWPLVSGSWLLSALVFASPVAMGCGGGTASETWTAGTSGAVIATLATDAQFVDRGPIAVDHGRVYWTATQGPDSGKYVVDLFHVSVDGGTVATISTEDPGASVAFAVDDGTVFWGGDEGEPWFGAVDITVDAKSVYWGGGGYVLKASREGGPPLQLAEPLDHGGDERGFAVSDANVYWTYSESVLRVPLDGGATTTLASVAGYPGGLAVDATNVYWGNETGGNVMSLPLEADGGTPATLATGVYPGPLVVDSQSIYFISLSSDGTRVAAMKVPLAGGAVTTVVSAPIGTSLGGIAVDATSLYWSSLQSVLKITPK